jgi:hypothetical protein
MIEPTKSHRIRYMDSLFSVHIRECVRLIGNICAEYELPTRAIRATNPHAAYYTNGKQSDNTTNANMISGIQSTGSIGSGCSEFPNANGYHVE